MWTIVFAGLLAALPFVVCGPGGGDTVVEESMFAARIDTVAEVREMIVLTRGGDHPAEARIAAWAGANLAGFTFDGVELIYGPEELASFDGGRPGMPVLYPTPCRIPGGEFRFDGREFSFPINRGDNHIHGLVRDIPWGYDPPTVNGEGASATLRVEFAPGSPLYEYFPIEHTIELTYTLDDRGLLVRYRLVNRDDESLPYGFGLHPYWNVVNSRQDVYLRIPPQHTMSMRELIPTGHLEPVMGTQFDLSEMTPLSEVEMDHVFYPAEPSSPAVIEWRKAGVRMELTHSAEFSHLIVWAPPGEPFVCVENMTASPDAHNLFDRGFPEESGLKVVPAGGSAEGWVRYVVDKL